MIAPGRYNVRITDQGLTKAGTGSDQFFMAFKVLEHADGEALDAEHQGATGRYFRVVNENTAKYFGTDLHRLGCTWGGDFRNLYPDSPHSMIGKEVILYAKPDTDQQGNPRLAWGVPGDGPAKASASEVDSLNQRFGAMMRAMFPSQGQPNGAMAPPPEDSDNPFM